MPDPGVYNVGLYIVHLDVADSQPDKLDVEGWEYYRTARVEGLAGSGSAQRVQAVLAVQALPIGPNLLLGSPHPDIPDALLRQYRPRTLSNGVVEVRILYKEEFGGTNNYVEVGSTAQQVQTNVGIGAGFTGNLIHSMYKGKQYGETVSKLVPNTTITVKRVEYASPGDKSKTYVGTVNDGPWDLDPSPYARCWLCTEITGVSADRGVSWQVTYKFVYQPPKSLSNPYAGGWDEGVITKDPATGEPYADYYNTYAQNAPDYWIVYPQQPFFFSFVA